jgi:para-aminobenzoate synthetase / 4-amino-4-deoxychorismate lyase
MQPAPPDPSLGVFETVLARGGRVQALDAHLERLAGSIAELYGAALPANLRRRVQALAERDPGSRRLRIDAIPAAELRIELTSSPLAEDAGAVVLCHPVVVPGGLGRHKWIDRRLVNWLGQDGSVPLLVDSGGELLEAASANVWLIEDGRLVTPPADSRILPGVTRAMLLELRHEAREEPITIARAQSAQALFVTSALRHALPAMLGDKPGDIEAVAKIRGALGAGGWS